MGVVFFRAALHRPTDRDKDRQRYRTVHHYTGDRVEVMMWRFGTEDFGARERFHAGSVDQW